MVPIVFLFALWMAFFPHFAEKQGLGGFMSADKSRTNVYVEERTGVGFADVAGVDEAKRELEEVVAGASRAASAFAAASAKGIVSVGPAAIQASLLAALKLGYPLTT